MTSEFTIAVHALVYLNHKQTTLGSEALAENVCTNPARIRKVMAKLRKAGLVETKEGANGGYFSIDQASSINLRQICEAVGENMISASWRSGDPHMKCLIASGMADLMDQVFGDLNEMCKKKLETVKIEDFDDQIFGDGNLKGGIL